MKKSILIVFVLILMISIKSISAATFYNYLPGGKNYLDENNFELTSSSLKSINPFLVKGDTFYTLSLPGSDMIGTDLSIEIYGYDLYFDGSVINNPNCFIDIQESYCTFKTDPSEDYISITMTTTDIVSFVNYYGFTEFQLEEGIQSTQYEQYIIPLVDSNDPEFTGSGAYIKSYSTFESIESIIDAHLTVDDEVDGDLTEYIEIESDSYTGNEQIVGDYLVELSVSDSSGNTAYFNLNILVKDEIAPEITGPQSVIYSVNDQVSINTIIEDNFIIEDEYSAVEINLLEDNYTSNMDILGNYSVSFKVVDENLNFALMTFQILLVDTEPPTVLTSLNIDSYLSNPYTLDSVLGSLEFEDNYTDMSTVDLDIISNEFEGNEGVLGTYIINFEVCDSSNNTLNTNLVINVIDDVSPQIGGPLTYQGSYSENLNIDDFINMLNVSDNIDSISIEDIYIIEDTYSARSSVTGSFSISFGIKDSSQNENTHSINITLFDDVAPIIYVDNYVVTVDSKSTFSPDDAISLLINSEELKEASYTVRTLFDGYSGNETNEGSYIYLLEFTNDLGESFEKEFVVNVIDNNENNFDKNLVLRNVIVYSISIGIFTYVVFKNRK